MKEATAEVEARYARWLHSEWVKFSGVSAVVGVTLVPLFSLLDYVVHPHLFADFLVLRLACAGMIAVLGVSAATWGKRYVRALTLTWLIAIQAMIAVMVHRTGGAASGYYAGLNLAIVAVGIILPTATLETVAFAIATFLVYAAACMGVGAGLATPQFVNNLAFLAATASIGAVGAHYLGARRYKEVLSEQLQRRTEELAELNRQRSEFFANISHELRTPLTLILAPVQELLESGQRLPDYLATRLGVVRDNALRLLKLVNDLLDMIRIEEGYERLANVPVEVVGLLGGLVDSMAFLADSKSLLLEKRLGDGRAYVRGDPRALEKIFVNLISNAIKFTQPGGAVSVYCESNALEVRVRVRDTGIGIAKSELPRIFDRFHQADGSSTRRYRGTGLGLALVRELTELMGGKVSVQSEPGAGAVLEVVLPRASGEPQADESASEEATDAIEALHRSADRRGGLTVDGSAAIPEARVLDPTSQLPSVLVVEDEPDMRRYLAEVLGAEYQVLQARTGTEGLRIALEQHPDLVLLDIMLPEMDGLDVCRSIRGDARSRSQRIMLLTARADEHSKLTALEQGADDFLTKPFSTVEVLTRLRNLLENARLERDLAARNARLERTLAELEATQAQLIQSEKLNALGSLSAGLLHEINNPLNYSLTAVQLLAGDPTVQGDELMSEIVADINEGMQRIRAIVSDLRAFAYPSEAEKQGAFDLNEAVTAALRFAAADISGIEVVRDLGECARVVGSKSHLTQVFINLFSNAAKAIAATRDGRVGCIRVVGEPREGRLQVRVSDNGIGMDAATLGRIFDPFFTTRDVGQGMGLGLSVCHTIVANHRGQLTAASRPGEGTDMGFDLALADRGGS